MIDPSDPRLQRVGYARIRSLDGDHELFVRKLEIILGRTSKAQAADLQLGDNMNISRQHAKIEYDKASKAWLMTVQGKNGLTVNGLLLTPTSPPLPLNSQDVIMIGDKTLFFLLPRDPAKEAARLAAKKRPASAALTGAGPAKAPKLPPMPSPAAALHQVAAALPGEQVPAVQYVSNPNPSGMLAFAI